MLLSILQRTTKFRAIPKPTSRPKLRQNGRSWIDRASERLNKTVNKSKVAPEGEIGTRSIIDKI